VRESYTRIIQSILAENPHETDFIAQEDEVFYRLGELCSDDLHPAILTEEEAMDCWTQFVQETRPDVRIVHLGEIIARPFYE
jgi:hypothetical protein